MKTIHNPRRHHGLAAAFLFSLASLLAVAPAFGLPVSPPASAEVRLGDAVRQYNQALDRAAAILETWRGAHESVTLAEASALLRAQDAEISGAKELLDVKFVRLASALSRTPSAAAAFEEFLAGFRLRHEAVGRDLRAVAFSKNAESEAAAARLQSLLHSRPSGRAPHTLGAGSPAERLAAAGVPLPNSPVIFDIQTPPRESTVTPAYMGESALSGKGDLDPTPDAQITPEIEALAAELGNSPQRIYEWVRNSTRFEPYFGSLKGSMAALETKAGNDYDLASLTIALLRASDIPARYVRGTVQINTEEAQAWLGVRHPDAVARVLGAAGIDNTGIDNDGDDTVDLHQIDRVWVEAQVPHANYRGVGAAGGGQVWVPLDPAFKLGRYQPGITGIPALVPFDEAGYFAARTTLLAYQWYQAQVEAWLRANRPGVSLADVPFRGEVVEETLGLLPASTPGRVIAFTGEWSEVPETLRHRLRVTLLNQLGTTVLDASLRDVEIARSRITISYRAASGLQDLAEDLGGLQEVPAFLAQLVPVLKIDGVTRTEGSQVSTGQALDIRVRLLFPQDDPIADIIHEDRPAGDYHAVSLDLHQFGEELLGKKAEILLQANTRVGTPQEDKDALEGQLLDLTGARYWRRVREGDEAITGIYHYLTVNQMHELLATANTTIEYLYDRPFAVTPGNLNIDAKRHSAYRVGLDGEQGQSLDIFKLEGRNGSAQEHAVWEEMVHVDSISTIKSLQYANETDINHDGTQAHGDVLSIVNAGQLAGLCPGFPSGAKTSMQNALAQGRVVLTPYCNFVYNDWHGVGWIEEDPATGAGAYLISGYLAGGETSQVPRAGAARWVPIDGSRFAALAACGSREGIEVLVLTAPPDVARLDLPAADRRRIREYLERGFTVRALESRVDCGSLSAAFFVEGAGLGWESTAGGSGTETDPPPVEEDPTRGQPCEKCKCPEAGLPVSLVNGNMFHYFPDVRIAGVGIDFEFQRTYNSQIDRLGPMGYGWSHTYDVFLVEDPGLSVTVTDGTGHQEKFTDLGGGSYQPPAGVHDRLERQAGGWKLTTMAGLVQNFNAAGKLVSAADPFANTITFSYNGLGRLAGITDTMGRVATLAYGADGLIDTLTDSTGRVWTYNHDAAGNLISSSTPADLKTPSYTTTYTYATTSYLAHNLTRVAFPEGYSIDFEYYANDKLFRHVEGGTRPQSYLFDRVRRMTTVTDPRGNEQRFHFDTLGRTTRLDMPDGSSVVYNYDANFNLVSWTDRAGYTWSNTWDARGRALTATDPLSRTETYTYATNFSHPSTYTDAEGWTTIYDVNGTTGRVTRIQDPEGGVIGIAYDSRGRIRTVTDRRGKVHTYSYDTVSGQRSRIDDPLAVVTLYGRDSLGRMASVTDPEGRTDLFEYDARDRVIRTTDPAGRQETVVYNGLDRQVLYTNKDGSQTNFQYNNLNEMTTASDAAGRETRFSWTEPGCDCSTGGLLTALESPGGGTWRIAYDSEGRVARRVNPRGEETTFSYDARHLPQAITYADGSQLQIEYDAAGQVLESNSGGEVTTFTYDDTGFPLTAANSTNTYTWVRDKLGRTKQVTDSLTGKTLKYWYDAGGLRTKLTDGENLDTIYAYDDLGRMTRLTDFDGQVYNFQYNKRGQPTRIEYPNGQVTTLTFEPAGYLSTLLTTGPGGTLVNRTFVHDPRGRLISQLDPIQGNITYTYDLVGRLVGASQPGRPDEVYAFDLDGNRVADASGLSWQYDAANRIIQRGSTTFTFDTRGNLMEREDPAGVTAYQYNGDRRMTSAALPNGSLVSFRYDPLGGRVEKTVDGQVTRILRDGDEVLARYNAGGTLLAKYVRTEKSAEALAVRRDGAKYFLHRDQRQSTIAVSNSSGNLVSRMLYDSYGNLLQSTGTWNDPVLFGGRDFDPELGLYDFQARTYDPVLGRFLQPDPKGMRLGMENLYLYTADDPINHVDPDGRDIGMLQTYADQARKFGNEQKAKEFEEIAAAYERYGSYELGSGDTDNCEGTQRDLMDFLPNHLLDKNGNKTSLKELKIVHVGCGEVQGVPGFPPSYNHHSAAIADAETGYVYAVLDPIVVPSYGWISYWLLGVGAQMDGEQRNYNQVYTLDEWKESREPNYGKGIAVLKE